jgi:phospholipase C
MKLLANAQTNAFGPWAALITTSMIAACSTTPGSMGVARDLHGLDAIDTVVVIYAENRAFDNLYGLFPGANGIPG